MTDTSLLTPALSWSGHLRRRIDAQPDYGRWLADAMTRPVDVQALAAWFDELCTARGVAAAGPLPVADCRAVLRRLRERVFCTVMARDLAGLAPLEEVVGAMTRLADLAIEQAYRSVAAELAEVHGIPREAASGLPQEMLIVGMGKLGGEELNVSSDIDLVMLYGDEGETDGRRPISHHEFYGRLTRRMMPVISEIDADGHVFRTDLRLRPDGDAGPLAWSLDAFENYLVSQGREWERYAWLKARRIEAQAFEGSDPASQAAQLEALRRPFVYRKYFDFDALAALRALRERIREDWNRRSYNGTGSQATQADNVKLGEGGIREIEFVVQLSQLIRGGRTPTLQERGLLAALHAEREAGLVQPEDAGRLEAAYRFLRRVEHALQYREDQQTHLLPQDDERRAELARALGFDDPAGFERTLTAHREFVETTFRGVFGQNEGDQSPGDRGAADPEDELVARIRATLPAEADSLLPRASALLDSPRIRSLPDNSRRRLAALLPAAVDACAGTKAPAAALVRMFGLIEHIAQRSAYMALLAEYPDTLARVARIFAASDWAAGYLTRHPLLLDELLDWRTLMVEPDLPAMARKLSDELDACVIDGTGAPDVERQMNLMRDTQRQWGFHLLAQDLEGQLTVERLGDYLSMVADIMLEETLKRVWYSVSRDEGRTPAHFAVIAYGKHGGKELGYASDLDLVFLFDDPREDAGEIYARFGQRILSWLGSMTASGRLYEVDLRLRPDGQAGLMVISTEAFERYQKEHAWPWEHQAITRARFAAGDPEVGRQFERIRREVLLMPRDARQLADEVIAMRRKISEGHPNRTPDFDLKHDPGGMVDVEFVTQYLVLLHAREHEILVQNLGNIALLRLAAEAGLIPADLARRVGDAYRTLRREQHALRLQDVEKARVPQEALTAERAAVIELWEQVLGPRS
ncbi:bifunctional [glutamate--ammonia ligase]-adenylyl-L-tyrosine phosphorylase/[glutamate--ammonia-ligase] adenylyltransferase [Pigmentiphaga sp. GD03639]|uniref:bifunctional [glutamate--ammonia ligase]-adenylyl-L-tyrosine phosphorylase/[glutamate--ammonia-ligase] adenylyltransferase n=1 Tax=unclassified Pigmentiphaga TaxID=2626614 RepID=UPI002449C0A5|nr:bifunctional [glutamate--ammonia ligase]-adenylyl-L-tyrosine phosphorylase/[glutamate--ammonia-ligase] adenylyltransferase [Pigmentiphaga sp. GD03639]MDH2237066.1 bifunctional [glutamate--ammonia ligase]-adenylyl-L-tyrosine phosphorylase/[glutamate--ammonia-ligase] adenylyltransferase [Pigmentiphaga sp. GD03639]